MLLPSAGRRAAACGLAARGGAHPGALPFVSRGTGAALLEVPALARPGLPGCEAGTRGGLLAPAGTPQRSADSSAAEIAGWGKVARDAGIEPG